ncbi:MAG: C40 family peptidase [Hyphomicrobiales bacterium]|nr:C40 family peptidase [Hyphomicrobiales bacterium]
MERQTLDPRLNAFRASLADTRLEGQVAAARFVEGTLRRVAVTSAPLQNSSEPTAEWGSELLRGETVRVYDVDTAGRAWVRNERDGYVGYCADDALGQLKPDPTDRVAVIRTFIYPDADMKHPPHGWLTLGSAVALEDGEVETRGTRFRLLTSGEGAVVASHLAPLKGRHEPDFVAVAERFVETPYLWGGRTSLGLDCSALVQLSLMTAGIAVPRDTDLQEQSVGQPVAVGAEADLARGDLVFWPGHVAIMVDAERIVHASGHHMRVVIEPLKTAAGRIAETDRQPTSVRRQ